MPVSTINFPFLVDGRNVPVFCKEAPRKWREAAEAKGFRLVARAQDRLHVILGCLSCGLPTLKRVSVVLGYEPDCPHCIGAGRKAAAASVGAKLVGHDPHGDRHYGSFQLGCGHTVRRQYHRVEIAAAGGHKLSCEICTQNRHTAEAKARDWQLIGPAPHRSRSYREYEHICSHRQNVAVANMRNGDVDCAGCGESWSSKPSTIYLFHFAFSGIELIKLGFSSNPEFRMRQVQIAPELTRATLVRTLPIPSGHDAICIEKALHSHIKANRPEFIVSPEIFRDHINTTSEIYHIHGRAYIERLMSAVEAGWNPRCGSISDFIDGKI